MSRKTDRRRKKRDAQKQLRLRKERAFDRQLRSDRYPVHDCRVNEDWEAQGMASIMLTRRTGRSRLTLASFLVDILGFGLKDAWGRVDMSDSEYRDMVRDMEAQMPIGLLDLDLARHLVCGGVEHATQYGFRLPHRYQPWLGVLGPLPAGTPPDMGLFGRDGKICIVSSTEQLRERLTGCTVEAFLERPDVEFILGHELTGTNERLVDDGEQCLQDLERRFLDEIRRWCFATGQRPHPLLPDCFRSMMGVVAQFAPDTDEPDAVEALSPEQEGRMWECMYDFLFTYSEHPQEQIEAALKQYFAYMEEMGSGEALLAALQDGED